MANANGWGDGASNNDIGWGKGADNAIGWGSVYSVSSAGLTDIIGTPAVDPDAQAFITAASITDPTQQSAINQLVVDLKGYNIWTKFKALYPFVGGTASQHKWNLKDPRDLDVAFRLQFFGGTTHSINGVQFGGLNGYADSFLNAQSNLTGSSNHLSYYSRTNSVATTTVEMGCSDNSSDFVHLRVAANYISGALTVTSFTTTTNASGFWLGNKIANNDRRVYRNTIKESTNTTNTTSALRNANIFIGARNDNGVYAFSTNKECAFASIGDGLTDTEAANFYTAVQAFQVSLGRSIGTQTVSDADAQAFVTNAGIVDQVEANAINNLVIGLKADGLWTKMKALYPMVGGSSSTMKYNLKNPLDTDAAFRLVFNGGWTFSSNGALPNGTNAYANTYLVPNSQQSVTSGHFSLYSRTSGASSSLYGGNGIRDNSTALGAGLTLRRSVDNLRLAVMWNEAASGFINAGTETDARGFYLGSRTANNSLKFYKNNSTIGTNTNTQSITSLSLNSYYLAVLNEAGGPLVGTYDNKQLAFASIGDGLSDAEATNFYNRVQTFNTALARQV